MQKQKITKKYNMDIIPKYIEQKEVQARKRTRNNIAKREDDIIF